MYVIKYVHNYVMRSLYVRVCNEIYNRVDECPLHVRYARIGGAGK